MDCQLKDLLLLRMLAQLMRKFGKRYTYASQKRLLELLSSYHGYTIKRRMLCYRLRDLEDRRLIFRQRRNKRSVDGRIEPMTTMITLSRKAHALINQQVRSWYRAAGDSWQKIFALKNPIGPASCSGHQSRDEVKAGFSWLRGQMGWNSV